MGTARYLSPEATRRPLPAREEVYAKDVLALSNKKIGGIGKAIFWLQTPLNFFLVIMLPLILLLVANGYFFIKMMINLKLKKALAEKKQQTQRQRLPTQKDAEQKKKAKLTAQIRITINRRVSEILQ